MLYRPPLFCGYSLFLQHLSYPVALGHLPQKLEDYVSLKTVVLNRSEFVEHYAVLMRTMVPDGKTNRVDHDAMARSVCDRHKDFLHDKHPSRSHVSIFIIQLPFQE